MNGMERAILDVRVAALRAMLPNAEELAATRAGDDVEAKRRALRVMERYTESAATLIEACEVPDDPLPLLPEPSSLVGGLRIRAYASTFGERGDERVMPGFWADLPGAVERGIPLTWSHDADYSLGRLETAVEDSVGLYVTALVYPPTTEWAETVRDALVAGLIGSMSYYARISTRYPAHLATLYEICVTAHPADPNARILAVERL